MNIFLQSIFVFFIGYSCSHDKPQPAPIVENTWHPSPMRMTEPLPPSTARWLYAHMLKRNIASFGGNPSPEIAIECHLHHEDDPCYFSKGLHELEKFPEDISETLYAPISQMRADLMNDRKVEAVVQCSSLEPNDPPYELEWVQCSIGKVKNTREHFLKEDLSSDLTHALIGNRPYPQQGILRGSVRCWWDQIQSPRCATRSSPDNHVTRVPHVVSQELGSQLKKFDRMTNGQQDTNSAGVSQLVGELYCEVDRRPLTQKQPPQSLCRIQMSTFKG